LYNLLFLKTALVRFIINKYSDLAEIINHPFRFCNGQIAFLTGEKAKKIKKIQLVLKKPHILAVIKL
jgi:hypothetical protein